MLAPFFSGLIAGFLLALTSVPISVWIVQVGQSRGWKLAAWVAASMSAALLFWGALCFAGFAAMRLYPTLFVEPLLRLFSGLVFAYVAFRHFRGPPIQRLRIDLPVSETRLIRHSFIQALFMPMRLPVVVAMLVTVGLAPLPSPIALAVAPLGFLLGFWIWWLHLLVLGALYGRAVPEAVTLRSLNKMIPFSGLVFLGLDVVVMLPLLELV